MKTKAWLAGLVSVLALSGIVGATLAQAGDNTKATSRAKISSEQFGQSLRPAKGHPRSQAADQEDQQGQEDQKAEDQQGQEDQEDQQGQEDQKAEDDRHEDPEGQDVNHECPPDCDTANGEAP